jgi:hypothetical protein
MSNYDINNYKITLELNHIIIKNDNNIYETNIDYNIFKICENNEQIYDLLNEKILNKQISFEKYDDYLECIINITKKDYIIFNIPKVTDNYKLINITEIDELIKLVNSQKKQIELLSNKISELEINKNEILFFELANINIKNNTKFLSLGTKSKYIDILCFNKNTHKVDILDLYNITYNYNNIIRLKPEYKNIYIKEFNHKNEKLMECLSELVIFNNAVEFKEFRKLIDTSKNKICNDKIYNFIKYFRCIHQYSNDDLLNLKYLKELKYLFISESNDTILLEKQNDIYDKLDYLSDSLEFIEINKLDNLKDITFCKKLFNLKGLAIIECPNIEDISCLKDLDNLIYLNIEGSSKITDISMLTNPKLQIIK